MAFAPALRAAIRALRGRPDGVLPAFLLTPAVSAVVRVVTLAGLATAYAYLEVTGRLAAFLADLAATDLEPSDPEAEPEAFAAWVEGFQPLLETLVTPATVGILAATILASLLLFVVLSAVTTAAQLGACRATLDDQRGTTAAIAAVRRHWLSILGLVVLEFVLWLLVTGVAVGVTVLGFLVSTLLGVILGLLAALVWLVAVVAIGVLFAFAPVAVIVDSQPTLAALPAAVGFLRSNAVDAVVYCLLAVGALGALYSVAALSPTAGGVVVGVGTVLVVAPVLVLTKTALYAREADGISPPASTERSLWGQLGDGARRGLAEAAGFARGSTVALAVSVLLFVGGIGLGWLLAAPYEGVVTASIEGRLAGHFPPSAAVFFAANNWTVAVGSAFGGIALAVPTAVSMVFNGMAFGVYGRLEAAPAELVAFVVPHGVLEIPAIVLAGALGLSLGATAWRTVRGRAGSSALADAIDRAFWVLVGLGIVLAVAGLVEGFVSPYYYQPFLGG